MSAATDALVKLCRAVDRAEVTDNGPDWLTVSDVAVVGFQIGDSGPLVLSPAQAKAVAKALDAAADRAREMVCL